MEGSEQGRITAGIGAAVVVFLLVYSFVPASPLFPSNPSRDSGVFLYTAQMLMEGKTPYVEVWDHKPPAIYLIDAVGLIAGGGSWWGVWGIELLLTALAALLLFRVLQRFGTLEATFGVGVLVLAATFQGGGDNYTEGYAIVFQALAIHFWYRPERSTAALWGIGITGAVAFLLKPPLVGIWIAIGLVDLYRSIAARRGVREVVIPPLASLLAIATVVGWVALEGGFQEMVEQVYHYNKAYTAGATWLGRWKAAAWGFEQLMTSRIALIGVTYWLTALLGRIRLRGPLDSLLTVALVDLPLELILASISARPYLHYFIPLAMPIAILTAIGISRFRSVVSRRTGLAVIVLATWVLFLPPIRHVSGFGGEVVPGTHERDEAVEMIRTHTTPGETVLVWGAEASVNFLARRESPTRYVYQYPLYTTGYSSGDDVRRFLSELDAHPPALIIDTSSTNLLVPPLLETGAAWKPDPAYQPPRELDQVLEWIRRNYTPSGSIRSTWTVFVRKKGD